MEIVKLYPKCFLGSVVNPGEYWLVSKLKSHVKEVKTLEEMLSYEMNEILTIPDSELLIPECCVAVENNSVKGSWQRGKIIEKLKKDMYKVFLVDSGCFIDTEIRNIQLIKEVKYLEVEPLAFKLHLYGVVPFTETDDHKKKVCKSWLLAAEKFVKNLFCQRLLIHVKKVSIVNRIVFGDLYLVNNPNCQPFSLTKLLCVEGCGVYAESYFRRTVLETESLTSSETNLDGDSNFSSDLTMQLEKVKQWQLSTAQYQVKSHKENPNVLKWSSRTVSNTRNVINSDWETNKVSACSFITGNNFVEGESYKEPVERTSKIKGPANIPLKISIPRLKKINSVVSIRADNNNCSFGKKEEFNSILKNNWRKCPNVGNDSSLEVFTLFRDCVVEPIKKFRNLNISENIILNLEKEGNFNDLSPIQQWAIPTIERGHHAVIIGSTKTGKSLSFVIPLLGTLQDRMNSEETSVGNGPMAIILCSGSRSCKYLYYICHLLLKKNFEKQSARTAVRVKVVHGNSCENESLIDLTNGCELLISTPPSLDRLLKYRAVTNFERLDYLVLDEIEVITKDPFLSHTKNILHQSKISKDCQRIFCGKRWTPELKNLVNVFAKNHSVLIGSYLEAAVYVKLKPSVLLVPAETKTKIVLDATLSKIGKYKICIVCECTSEVLHVYAVFKRNGYAPLVAHSDMVTCDIKALRKRWKLSVDAPIMICCDDVLHQLAIEDAEMLIHYSLPAKSKTNFGFRFSTVLKSYRENSLQVNNKKEPSVLILIDDQNHYQLPHIVDLILRMGGKVPEKVQELSQEILWRIEANKRDTPLCFNLLEFGECKNLRNCSRRHAFIKEIDSSENFASGLVKFQILQVHSLCHLSVRLIEFHDKSGNLSKIEDHTAEIYDKLQDYYKFEENRRFIGEIEVNKLCAVEKEHNNGKLFQRGQIVELKESKKFNKVVEVFAKLVDTGELSWISIYKLYELPEELKSYKPQAFEVFLCNLLPNDFDEDWSEEAIFSTRSLYMKPSKENQYWMGKIRLSLKNSLHLESMQLYRFLENVNTHVIDYDARKRLLKEGLAVENRNHLEKLRILCEKANIGMSSYKALGDGSNVEIVEPQWAFLEEDLQRVNFVSGDSVSRVFLQIAKFSDLFEKLTEDCQKKGYELKSLKKKLIPAVGMYCLASFENAWNRGRIQSVEEGKILVFFIDYGDCHYVDDLVPIPATLLTQLPAQAIECCLGGVKEVTANCNLLLLDEIYSFSNDGMNQLYVSVIGKSKDSQMTGGWRYHVNLLDENGISLNRKLFNKGLVEIEKSSFHLIEDIKIVSRDSKEVGECSTDNEEGDLYESCPDTENERLPVDCNDPSYMLNLSEDIFDDENAQLMLEELDAVEPLHGLIALALMWSPTHFTRVKPYVQRSCNGYRSLAQYPHQKKFMAQVFPRSVLEKREKSHQKLEVCEEKKALPVTGNKLEKPGVGKLEKCTLSEWYTPDLVWCQNHSNVEMKIMLNNVGKYRFDCTSSYFLFRCLLDGKLYAVGLKLFGSINPQLTEVRIKTFYVHIILKKLCPLLWPRLPTDKIKYRWIRYDMGNYTDEETTYVEEICRKALAEVDSGHIKHGRVKGEIMLVPSTDSEEDAEEDADDSEGESDS